ncbi:NUDIX domain-containing protein [Variovorax sp. KK3]|uniref:NUDIX domain-containing protein n=1 Tax=Variovorax sp. KK3 TaxID=1855728 RepID=UPI0015C2FB06|nr:NUDIX hydrolase [Variovorax sp. KK3]
MTRIVSCGIVMMNASCELFVCHATGTARWDLPKGWQEVDESARQTAVRETWEETSLVIDPDTLVDLGVFAYLPAKNLHLFGMRVAADVFEIGACRCHSTFANRITGLQTFEVDGYAWKSRDRLSEWCAKNLTRVLEAIDWTSITRMPAVGSIEIRCP